MENILDNKANQKGYKVGIYKITNPIGKVYIGQSTNIFHRWDKHYKKFQ
jgi:predicted GIY-YIG superfamily endonuclease